MIHRDRSAERPRVGRRRAEHQQAGDAERVAAVVTPEAGGDPLELRGVDGTLIQRVEDDAFRPVLGGHFEDLAVAHPAEHDAVGEEERPRIGGADPPRLQARL